MVLIQALLLALPLSAQTMERGDCDTVVVHNGSVHVCGTDRETLAALHDRIETTQELSGRAFTEALRAIACDANQLDLDLRRLVNIDLGNAARIEERLFLLRAIPDPSAPTFDDQ